MMMRAPYTHTQRGTALVVLPIAASVATLVMLVGQAARMPVGARITMGTVVIVLLLTAIAFATLTIQVDDEQISWYFGPRAFRKSVPLRDVAAAEPTTTRWIEGLGIHWTTRGWLYNVAGRGAVLVTLRDGRRFLLGTDEPESLTAAILSALR